MDFTKLRAAALKSGDDEEAVTVNTRALIDKVLARYSGEWTTLRECIQNAADAQATTVKIKFETLPSTSVPTPKSSNASEALKHVILHHTLRRLLITNDGQSFNAQDWSRLKRIAEGNPDETKIGAFGVGFYSVFADCEEPFVSSGNEAMAFYWKGNSLFTRKLQLPTEQGNPETSFVLDYRNMTTSMPNLLSIAQFLATSLTFVALQHVELWVDDWKVLSLQKKAAPSIVIPIAKDVETKTKEGLMKVQSLERESVQLDAIFMNVIGWRPANVASKTSTDSGYGASSSDLPSLRSFFSGLTQNANHNSQKNKAQRDEQAMQEIVLEDLTALTTTNVFLSVTSGSVRTNVNGNFAAELERATKKPPPKQTRLAIVTSSYDEAAASSLENPVLKGTDVFANVLPSRKPGGRVFIGFPTSQSTGAGVHLSAPSVIPTVERESIDLNARYVRTWNVEMLRVAGIITRLAFAGEMADLSSKVIRAAEVAGHGSKVTKVEVEKLMPEAVHILNTFSFSESTPSNQVSQIIEEAFWTAFKKPSIEIYSSRGVLPTTQVRLGTEDLSGFVEGIPVVPDNLLESKFVCKLKDFGLIEGITIKDVKQELERKSLNKDQLIQFISWAGKGNLDSLTIQNLLEVTVATIDENEGQGDVIALGTIKYYLNVSKIPAEVPLPPTTLPFSITRTLKPYELQVLGWETLEVVPWLRYIIEAKSQLGEKDLTTSSAFAATVLQVVSKAWDGLSQSSKVTIVSLLQPLTIVPTKFGLKKPGHAYVQGVKLFDDLPTVVSCPGVKEKVLVAIGVRKTVDLDTIFERLLAAGSDNKQQGGRHMELIKYLASVRDEIPAEDLKRLKGTPICPAEAGPKGVESSKGTSQLYKVSELFEPREQLRDLQLQVLQWLGPPGSYRPGSNECRFLTLLGLRAFPSVPELIDMMVSEDGVRREKAMTYFIANHHLNGYASFDVGASNKAFLPLESGAVGHLVPSSMCFTNERCAVFGFSILRRDLHIHANKFGIATDPPITDCVNKLLVSPPQSRHEASILFGYFSTRLGEVGANHVAKLADARIVPVSSQKPPTYSSNNEKPLPASLVKHLSPRQVYLGNSTTYTGIFDFVDFGNEANTFLLKCGSKHEPTKSELAAMVCSEPARLLGVMGDAEKYLSVLRSLADEVSQLKRDKNLWKRMRASPFLLGTVDVPSSKNTKTRGHTNELENDQDDDDMEDTRIKQYKLAIPSDIVIADDYTVYRLFRDSLTCAPLEERLEEFYFALGSQTVSELVQEDIRLGSANEKQAHAVKLRSHVLERSKLFLHEFPTEQVKHPVSWLDKNLSVQVVSGIQLRRSLRGQSLSHTEKRSAACINERHKGWILYATSENDSFQISQAICKLLLERPNQQSYLTFESFLSLTLLQLRARGYNVDRILKAKAAEKRIAEEERRKQLAAEQESIRAQEQEWKQQKQEDPLPLVPAVAKSGNRKSIGPKMPGAFGSDSPPSTPPQDLQQFKNKSRGIFSNLTRQLGINSNEAQRQLQSFLGNNRTTKSPDHPPSYDESEVGREIQKQPNRTGGPEEVSSPAAVNQNLLNAIQSSRPHNSSTLFSPPTTSVIKETSSYCDSTPASNLTFLAETPTSIRIFISQSAPLLSYPDSTAFLRDNSDSLNTFAALLIEVADVFGLQRQALHIFYDEQGGTIGFNSSGSVFANFRFWKQLHGRNGHEGTGKVEAVAYWWVVLAHELAHNLVGEHSAEHSFYTEQLISNYFPKMMAKSVGYLQNGLAASQPKEIGHEPHLLD